MTVNLSRLEEDRRKNTKDHEDTYLASHFERRMDQYRVLPVTTPELMKIFLKMRHQIFCDEHPEYEMVSSLNSLESDQYDEHAVHFLVYYEPLHLIVGGMRVILPVEGTLWLGMPSLEAEGSYFQEGFPHDLSKFCEISRFLLVKERMKIVRTHQADKDTLDNYPDVFRHMVRTVFAVCRQKGLMGFLATLEESLFRRGKYFFGMSLTKYGEPFEYHGKRQGGYVVIEDALNDLKEMDARIYNFLSDSRDLVF